MVLRKESELTDQRWPSYDWPTGLVFQQQSGRFLHDRLEYRLTPICIVTIWLGYWISKSAYCLKPSLLDVDFGSRYGFSPSEQTRSPALAAS